MPNFIHLTNRQLISISGEDRFAFLQGLITNDITKISENKGIYALMLNPQGRFLFEFFAVAKGEEIILEVASNAAPNLIKKLGFYKLRSKVEIKKIENLEVFFVNDVTFAIPGFINVSDPRKESFGQRIYAAESDFLVFAKSQNLTKQNLDFYNLQRLQNKIVDENDLVFDKSLIVEYGFDDFNAISYQKGCYVGQELVARSHYRGQIRKKIFLIEIEDLKEIALESEITCEEKKQGVVLSSIFTKGKLQALGLIKNVDAADQEIDLNSLDLSVNSKKIIIKK